MAPSPSTSANKEHLSELGKMSQYDDKYNPERLFAIPRQAKRDEINLDSDNLPFYGRDYWTHYEVSWLNQKGKPMVAIAIISYDCNSPMIIESKSLKLYFNSFNNSKFDSVTKLEKIITQDLENVLQTMVNVTLTLLADIAPQTITNQFDGESIDNLDITCEDYTINPKFLQVKEAIVEETLHSDLLKSNCLVTNQPDWGSIKIQYRGKQLCREGLLKYIVSFRNHNEFHEQCIERIFNDILTHCKPEKLTVYGHYTRRGGIEINPYRSSEKTTSAESIIRLVRQ